MQYFQNHASYSYYSKTVIMLDYGDDLKSFTFVLMSGKTSIVNVNVLFSRDATKQLMTSVDLCQEDHLKH